MSILFSNVEQSKILLDYSWLMGFPDGLVIKNLPAKAGDTDSMPGFGWAPGIRNGNPLQYVLPGKSQGQRSLAGYRGYKELDTTEWLHMRV